MPASLRELRQRRTSVQATKKITRAMELIAASRIVKAQQRATAAAPYSRELTRAVSAVATLSDIEHPLTSERPNPKRAAVLLITSDRGLAGAYSSSAIKACDGLTKKLQKEGKEVVHYLAGRKGVNYFTFRKRPIAAYWDGFSEDPTPLQAHEIAQSLITAFLDKSGEGVDEIHIVYTRFVSMLNQSPEMLRMLPLEVVESDETDTQNVSYAVPTYAFEPSADAVLDALLPLYVANRIHYCLLQSAASELASRQKAMKSATDNAQQLIDSLTRQANQARQAEITQEISEIVGGAAALTEANAANE
ncbi:MAG: F0F1 ATP synthase subunit gamma [Propionibacteriaceae bacterium]